MHLSKLWNNHWYQKVSPEFLDIQRILFFGFLAFYTFVYEGQHLWAWSLYPEEFWRPVGLFVIFDSPPFNGSFLYAIESYWPWILTAAAVGICTRLFTVLAFLIQFIFLGCSLCYGEGSYDHIIGSCFLFIFAVSKCGHSLSLDAIFFNKKERPKSESYFWPIRLQQWVFCSYFVGAALSKLDASGLHWIFSDTLKNYIEFSHYGDAMSPWATSLGISLWVASIPWLVKSLAAATIALELFTPLGILLPRIYRYLFMFAHLLMIIGFYFVATEGFMNLVGLYFCWFADLFYILYIKFKNKCDGRYVGNSLKTIFPQKQKNNY
ncbi:MAG: hypothetical protein MK008_08170 [Bdellovibrionales bacterium]|nr:hypothetical protein [Bdellovibrionales bacterium]